MDIPQQLSAPFPASLISWRVGSTNGDKTKGMALAYIDARDAQDRLNEVCGLFGWQSRHEVSGDKRVTCHVGIRNPETGEWVWKSDGAGETDYEGEKGSYSDSFKRACVKWGIGRYLYDVPSPWIAIEQRGKTYIIPDGSQRTLNEKLSQWQSQYFSGRLPDPARIASATANAWDSLDEDGKAYLLKIASRVIESAMVSVASAAAIIDAENFNTDEKAALWTRFDSKLRSALTKYYKERSNV